MKQEKSRHEHSPQNTVDHLLLLFVLLTFVSGHVLDHVSEGSSPSGSRLWLCVHIAVASGFTVLSLVHFKHHWGWFRTLPRKLAARRKDSLFLLAALVVLLVSGVLVTLGKTHVSGFTHAVFGTLCLVVGIYHFYVRHVRGKRK